ncbi:MAG: helix-turn-helix domain-containing protein [Streptosporangiaceae bacterium]|nr:helix-turn-helix domain-containing protein [Streptosporangiaceae bacterium]
MAEMLHIGRDKVYYLLRTKQLRSLKIGKLRRITDEQLAEFIASLNDAALARPPPWAPGEQREAPGHCQPAAEEPRSMHPTTSPGKPLTKEDGTCPVNNPENRKSAENAVMTESTGTRQTGATRAPSR